MHRFIMFVGGMIALVGLIIFAFVFLSGGGNATSFLLGLSFGGGAMIGGALLYVFGAIVEHLIVSNEHLSAIRFALESAETIRVKRDEIALRDPSEPKANAKICPKCFTENSRTAVYCRHCHWPFRDA